MRAPKPNILFIDAYDSFTNNIISLLTTTLACSVRVVSIDTAAFPTDSSLYEELRHYDAVVCGPGPGNPLNDKDVGLMKRIWALPDQETIPVLGICLGFQSLATTYGAGIKSLEQGLHGMVRRINYKGENTADESCGIFEGVGEVHATLYQSLCVGIGQDLIPDDEWEARKWLPGWTSPELQPLAWVEQETNDGEDRRILVAIQHITRPFCGLQYHPESICTDLESRKVVRNWFVKAQKWNRENGRDVSWGRGDVKGLLPTKISLLEGVKRSRGYTKTAKGLTTTHASDDERELYRLVSKSVDLPHHVSFTRIVEALQGPKGDQVILESSNSHINQPGGADVRGRFSIIALDIDDALTIEYSTGSDFATLLKKNVAASSYQSERSPVNSFGGIWGLLASFLEDRKVSVGNAESPFWGGFIGYTTYELGLESIGVDTGLEKSSPSFKRPDLCFAWVEKSVVVDHLKKKIYIQELVPNRPDSQDSSTFFGKTMGKLQVAFKESGLNNERVELPWAKYREVRLPQNSIYEAKVRSCQENIHQGESYELCLTDQTDVQLPVNDTVCQLTCTNSYNQGSTGPITHSTSHTAAWAQYKKLRAQQPAPFGSFLRLGGATFISASPERFLKWDADGRCELRPMKGTVKKTTAVSTLAQAEALLQIPKEQAENLMIVDLVRHDLYSVCGPGNVTVPRLMVVEEYASVFQMISIVQGQIPVPAGLDDLEYDSPDYKRIAKLANSVRHSGIDVLATSLPPGSMTGAPKKRSCEILQVIEGERHRSLYSGVVGYMDVGGRGDFSVNIRCMFRWDDEVRTEAANDWNDHDQATELWHIGAGGAVTALSTAVGEREEMQTKLQGTLGIFR
jgi:para-aminobenzoate synthetase